MDGAKLPQVLNDWLLAVLVEMYRIDHTDIHGRFRPLP